MAARWGAGDGTLTIGGMELFTAAGSLQCHNLEEDETCDGLSDLTLSSLDAGGILGTFQGYIDNSIISIIDDPAAQAEKGLYDDENELSLLTALTEILDNADDEKMSPFDSIPDTELLVSPKDREGSAKLFALSRTPPDHDMFSLDGQRRATPSKISGPNWELFPDAICSTPKRRTRRKSLIACLPRRAEAEETQQRSDGEDEELLCVIDKSPGVLTHDNNLDVNDGDPDQILIHGTPCIINTEKFALSELVKYMHPYCLPAITMCLESEDDENLKDAVFLEIVSEQGECIKVPVVVEPPADILCPESSDEMTGMDVEVENLPNHLSSSEKVAPELEVHDYIKKADGVHEELTESVTVVPKLQDSPPQHPPTNIIVKSPDDDDSRNSEEVVPDCKSNSEPDIAAPIVSHEKLPQKVKRSGRAKKPSKSKSKSKAKIGAEDKSPDAPELIPVQSVAQPPTIRPTNPSLQESDFLVKTLDQVKKESQMELRSSKTGRAKARTRASMDASNTERKVAIVKIKTVSMESERAKSAIDVGKDLEQNPKVENPVSAETLEPATKAEVLQSDNENIKDILVPSDVFNGEESGASKVEDVQDGDSLQMKEAKPKSLSLSEYRKRLQHRQPKPARENENLSCSKWPTVPETPTELAELPCLIVPGQSMKPSVEEKACPPKKASNSGREIPVSSAPVPAPITNQEVHHLNENLRPAGTVVAPPAITPQPNVPPQFYPPVWPTVAPHPSFYPGMPPLAAVPHYPNSMPAVLPVQPPPVMSWPPFPPPPIAVPPVHPTGWVPGPPTPYWPNVQMAQGMPEIQSLHNSSEKSVPFAASNLHVLPVQEGRKESVVPAVERRPQAYRIPAMKPENSVGPKEPKNDVTSKCLKSNSSSLSMKAAKKSQNAPVPEPKKENILIPDMKSANQMVFKIMEILKKAQKLGFQIKPASKATIESAQPGIPMPPSVLGSKPAQPGQTVPTNIKMLVGSILPTQETPAMVPDVSSKAEKTIEKFPAQEVAEDKVAAEPVVLPRAEPIGTSEESFQTTADSDPKESEKSFACESGIEATDLTSLLEQFEKSEAKEEERLPQSPDKLAVGNSGLGKTLEKKIHEKQLAPELVNTAGLTPPATPPHQLWKSVVTRPVTGKSRSLHGQEKTCSPLKTAKLIEPKPLPQSLLKSRSVVSSPTVSVPPVHVASGDHDYCILSSQQAENKATPAPSPASCEEGSRWNVKHHPNITIKPIVQFNKQQQLKAFPKPPAPSAPSAVANQSTTCGPVIPIAPCESIRKASTDPLDHRTNVMAESAVASAPTSVLMSPDSSPCRSENGESRTDVKRGDASSRRALRCYRKYKGSPSPKKSWRDRTSGSGSGSRSSSSSSRSRSGSPASKRRRTSRYRSRSRHRSRSSSRSSYGTSGSSRSSSCSSRSCTPSSSQSRSRSPSPYGRRGRSRSRRCESRESYNRRKMFHKERAIEERRVVYIGKINSLMTRSELSRRFSIFGEIEECTIHFREEGDNYGFVTYRCTREAFAAIENGHKLRLPDELPFDLCFGGRRQFCKSNYADLDSNRDDFDPAPVRSKFEALDFDTLLKQAQKNHRR